MLMILLWFLGLPENCLQRCSGGGVTHGKARNKKKTENTFTIYVWIGWTRRTSRRAVGNRHLSLVQIDHRLITASWSQRFYLVMRNRQRVSLFSDKRKETKRIETNETDETKRTKQIRRNRRNRRNEKKQNKQNRRKSTKPTKRNKTKQNRRNRLHGSRPEEPRAASAAAAGATRTQQCGETHQVEPIIMREIYVYPNTLPRKPGGRFGAKRCPSPPAQRRPRRSTPSWWGAGASRRWRWR